MNNNEIALKIEVILEEASKMSQQFFSKDC
jgi:hypothetical protein